MDSRQFLESIFFKTSSGTTGLTFFSFRRARVQRLRANLYKPKYGYGTPRPRQYAPQSYNTFSPPPAWAQYPPPPPVPRKPVPPPTARLVYNTQNVLSVPPERRPLPASYYSHVSPAPSVVQGTVPTSCHRPTNVQVTPKTTQQTVISRCVPPKPLTLAVAPTNRPTPQPPKPPPSTQTLTTTTIRSPAPTRAPTRTVTCYICLDTHNVIRGADDYFISAPCNDHWYCPGCLRTLFIAATKDESLFPPSCCRKPFGQSTLFLLRFLEIPDSRAFLQVVLEFTTPVRERIYCAQAVLTQDWG